MGGNLPTDEEKIGVDSAVSILPELVNHFETKVFHLALHLTNSVELAERVLLEVFSALQTELAVRTANAGAAMEEPANVPFPVLIYRLTIAGANSLLTSAVEPPLQIEKVIVEPAPTNGETTSLKATLLEAIACLPREYKLIFWLSDVAGLALSEAAESLYLTPFEARARLHRARLMIYRQLSRRQGTAEDASATPCLPGDVLKHRGPTALV
jgi:hypothetical protein